MEHAGDGLTVPNTTTFHIGRGGFGEAVAAEDDRITSGRLGPGERVVTQCRLGQAGGIELDLGRGVRCRG